jgi:hypothetical protein
MSRTLAHTLETAAISRSTNFNDLPEILTVEEVGHYLGIGRNNAYALSSRDLGAIRLGPRRMIVLKTALGSFLGASKPSAAGTP